MQATTTQQIELPQEFHNLLDERQTLHEVFKDLKKALEGTEATKAKPAVEGLNDRIKGYMRAMKISDAVTAKWKVTLTESDRWDLDENLLLANGVTADIIASSKKKTPIVTLRVNGVKENKA